MTVKTLERTMPAEEYRNHWLDIVLRNREQEEAIRKAKQRGNRL